MEKEGTSSSFEESVRFAFAKAKKDILTVLREINEIKEDFLGMKKEITSLKEKNQLLFDLLQRQEQLLAFVKEATTGKYPPASTGTSSTGNERVRTTPEALLLHEYKAQKPMIIKRKILELIPENGTASLFSLYTKLVLQHQLCGKTTFYRYIHELCGERQVTLSLHQGQRVVMKRVMEKVL